jgi:hypothetical protein
VILCLQWCDWKEYDEPFWPVQAKFEFHRGDYEKQFLQVLSRKDKTGVVLNNPSQCFSSLTDSTCRLQETQLPSSSYAASAST